MSWVAAARVPLGRREPPPPSGGHARLRDAAAAVRLAPGPYPIAAPDLPGRGRLGAEILIVLGLSLGASAAYSVVSIVNG